jgi:hypothetical protein
MSAESSAASNSHLHAASRTLGICWVIYGIIRLAMALWLFLINGTATVMFGALLTRVPDPFTMMSEFHIVYVAIIVLSVICGLLGIIGGLAAMGGGGRNILILTALLSLSEIPLGLTLGVYTLAVLVPRSDRA